MAYFKHELAVKSVLMDAFAGDELGFSEERAARYRVAATKIVEGLDRILDYEYAAIDGNTSKYLDETFVGKLDGLREEFAVYETIEGLDDAVTGMFDEMMRELYDIGDTVIEANADQNKTLKFIFVS